MDVPVFSRHVGNNVDSVQKNMKEKKRRNQRFFILDTYFTTSFKRHFMLNDFFLLLRQSVDHFNIETYILRYLFIR